MKKLYGLIGYPLGHSFSEKYFTDKFRELSITDSHYRLFPLPNIKDLPTLLKNNPELCGLNVTIPYKEQVIPYLDSIDSEAQEIGAVNCIRIESGKLTGYNADAFGFETSLLDLLMNSRPKNALILGTGGASKAVKYVLDKLGIESTHVSRTSGRGNITYNDIDKEVIVNNLLIVNTTPLGTYPNEATFPDIPYSFLTSDHFLYDLVYNPPLTEFLRKGQEQGAKIKNGYEMLVGQAERSWEIWNSITE